MKRLAIILLIIAFAVNEFPQSKTVKTGLYLTAPKDSCTGKSNLHKIAFDSGVLCLEKAPIITAKDIESCKADSTKLDDVNSYALSVKLKKAAGLKLQKVTEKNVGKKIAMIIDNEVVMAATIRDPLTSGMFTISGESSIILKGWETKLKKEMSSK